MTDGSLMGTLSGLGRAAYIPEAGCNGLCALDALCFKNTIVQAESWTIHLAKNFALVFHWNEQSGHYSLIYDDELIRQVENALESRPSVASR